ncbi:adenylate cyclase [Verrucomicrobium sp. GAS474]|uniref:adenylate/guanylate cyclase domain-containing protein n=1 Tax=Verrucomicrobium sp. GAS474 TaxID=1882831 RepID=UPI00087A1A51|nr:adenylate/guanylate cyclase domain-containing protein [Verrucomicrobium sp. GAS474]SDT95515.1 adenylate cyclase [Verrucomicrobium sp. GAS474]
MRFTLTLRRLFLLSLFGLVAGLAVLFWQILSVSETTLLRSAEQFQSQVAHEAAKGITDYLGQAPSAVSLFEKGMNQGLVRVGETASVRSALLSLLLADESLSEVSFTSATTVGTGTGFDKEGNRLLVPGTATEISVFRSKFGEDRIVCRKIWFDREKKRFVSESVVTEIGSRTWTPRPDAFQAVDPTDNLTFQTPASEGQGQGILSTDLHWSQLDDALPEAERRVELSFMKAMSEGGKFAGVLRVGLLKERISQAVTLEGSGLEPRRMGAPTVFLCDEQGRLIAASFDTEGKIAEVGGGDLRLAVASLPDEVRAALASPVLPTIGKPGTGGGAAATHATAPLPVLSHGQVFLCTFRALPGTQDWIVGVMAPRDSYLGPLIDLRHRLLGVSLALIAAIIVVGFLVLRGVGRAHGLITAETARMNAFDFAPSRNRSALSDIGEVLAGLERAKTAMRAMGKYVPVDLVRRLYRDGREPVLGGETADLSLLFTDIRDFTVFSEATPPDRLAVVLGRYLDAMAQAIQGEAGTIDKYIGDAVMAFWNAPEPLADHPVRACRAALRCREALGRLYDSPGWRDEGLPRFETRLGLHRCAASVGHFGAADRFNYTAIGDGVNLASRLESLNRHYGTAIVVSEAVWNSPGVREAFLFRRLDRVAVKGKAEGVAIFELLGEIGMEIPAAVARYEKAFDTYQRGDFAGALGLLEGSENDGPSRFLAERCRRYLKTPPESGWDGVQVFDAK